MYLILLAEDYGTKMWPFTSESVPKSLIPMYSDKNLLEETFGRMPADFMDVNKIFIVTTHESGQAILKTKMLDYYNIPKKNIIMIPLDRGNLVSMAFSIRYIEKIFPNIDPKEVVLFCPVDHFFWPPELFAFHFFNLISYMQTVPNKLMCASIQPGGPTGQIDFIQVDWNSVQPIGMSQDIEDEDETSLVSMNMNVTDFHKRTDIATSKKLMEKNWLWEIQTYAASFSFFKKTVYDLFKGFSIDGLADEFDNLFKSKWWYWKQQWNRAKNKNRWESFEKRRFNKDILPVLIAQKRVTTVLLSKTVWCILRDWVSLKQLLYNTGLFTMTPPEGVHQIEAERNLVFKPTEKEITLVGVNDLIVVDSGDKLLIATPEGLYDHF